MGFSDSEALMNLSEALLIHRPVFLKCTLATGMCHQDEE